MRDGRAARITVAADGSIRGVVVENNFAIRIRFHGYIRRASDTRGAAVFQSYVESTVRRVAVAVVGGNRDRYYRAVAAVHTAGSGVLRQRNIIRVRAIIGCRCQCRVIGQSNGAVAVHRNGLVARTIYRRCGGVFEGYIHRAGCGIAVVIRHGQRYDLRAAVAVQYGGGGRILGNAGCAAIVRRGCVCRQVGQSCVTIRVGCQCQIRRADNRR